MLNQAMQRKLTRGEAIDVETIAVQHTEHGPAYEGVYRLQRYVDDRDYCVGSSESWIWSIGRRLSDGAIFAATDARFYQNPAFECLWLR
jgi:hypothetical protein